MTEGTASRLMLSQAREAQEEGLAVAHDSVPASERTDVPTGSVQAVMSWVGDDPDRAQRALDVEQAKIDDEQRSTLIERLESLANSQ